jgi:hypothetical protein
MPRFACAFGLFLAACALIPPDAPLARARAAQPDKKAPEVKAGLAGNWKLVVPVDRDEEVVLLIGFVEKDGKWSAEYRGCNAELKVQPVMASSKIDGDAVQFAITIQNRELVSFEGALSKDKKKLNGSLAVLGGRLRTTTLFPTALAKLDDFGLAREALAVITDDAEVFGIAFAVLSQAGEKKLPADEARGVVERVNKAAATFGPRWERDVSMKLVEVLTAQDGLGELAIAQAKRSERMLTDDDTLQTRMTVTQALIGAMSKAGKPDDAKPYVAQLAKLELRDFAEYSKTHPPFKPEAFAGHKAKSERASVVEVFTGAECPPCVAVDLAFDGLLKTYKPTDVIFLQYHLHIPRPDPLTSPDANERADYYGDKLEGTPATFINGKLGSDSGGGAPASEKFYKQFRTALDEALEKPATVKLAVAVSKAEKGGFTAKATVSDLENPGEKVVLRFVLAEDRVRYAGGNGLRYHHMVVRALPGGAKGTALTKKSAEQSVTIDPDALRTTLNKYLDDFATKNGPFPRPDRPLAMRNLKLIALVQNDATKEILNAVQVDLDAK